MAGTEKKNSTKFQIINYIINHKAKLNCPEI